MPINIDAQEHNADWLKPRWHIYRGNKQIAVLVWRGRLVIADAREPIQLALPVATDLVEADKALRQLLTRLGLSVVRSGLPDTTSQ